MIPTGLYKKIFEVEAIIYLRAFKQGKKNVVQQWNFVGPIFQANTEIIERFDKS